jgi:hypothetical protein
LASKALKVYGAAMTGQDLVAEGDRAQIEQLIEMEIGALLAARGQA